MIKNPKITYFGIKIPENRGYKSTIQTLEPLLGEFSNIKTCSQKEGRIMKLLEMVQVFLTRGIFSKWIIIDVYSTTAFYFAVILGFFSTIFRKRYILILHGGNLPDRYKTSRRILGYLFSHAHLILAPSNYLKSFFESKGFKVKFVSNVLEIENYNFSKRRLENKNIISLRGFGKDYNPLLILKSLVVLKVKFPDVLLYLLGNETEQLYSEVLEFIKKNELTKNVVLMPKMKRDDWISLAQTCQIMISTPNIDNTPVSVMEGMALGMCVISTNVGGIPFLLDHEINSLLIPADNTDELTNSIERLFENIELVENISKEARKKAELFSWNSVRDAWIEILEVNHD